MSSAASTSGALPLGPRRQTPSPSDKACGTSPEERGPGQLSDVRERAYGAAQLNMVPVFTISVVPDLKVVTSGKNFSATSLGMFSLVKSIAANRVWFASP